MAKIKTEKELPPRPQSPSEGPLRRNLLITGANGFVARNIIHELLNTTDALFSSEYKSYTQIYAIDMCSGDVIARATDSSLKVIPVQMDLNEILEENSLSSNAIRTLLSDVDCVIHTAALVDTREHEAIRKRLYRVNVDIMRKLLYLSNECGVRRFLHMSSASGCNARDFSLSLPWYLKLLKNSLFTNLEYSTYATTKRKTEDIIQRFIEETKGEEMKVLSIRPHSVWGKGDPLGTEVMLQWKSTVVPQPFIGDPDSMVVAINVRTVARYILLADIAMKGMEKNQEMKNNNTLYLQNGMIVNIGENLITLSDLHHKIMTTTGLGRYATSLNPTTPKLATIPHFISVIIILIVHILDWITGYRSTQPFFRLVTANNLGYTWKGLVWNQEYVDTYKKHCQLLFHSAKLAIAFKDTSTDKTAQSLQLNDDEKEKEFQQWLDQTKLTIDRSSSLTHSKNSFHSLSIKERYHRIQAHPVSEIWSLGPLQLKNRVIKAATYESMGDLQTGVPTEQLINFHRSMAKGGVGMTIVAYASVSYDGRSFPNQICLANDEQNEKLKVLHKNIVEKLKELVEAVHQEDCKACIQLTHAGAFNDPSTNLQCTSDPPRGPSAILNPLTFRYSVPLMEDEVSLRLIEEDFVSATRVCRDVIGFDAIELHLGHGYLLSQFLSRRTNPSYAQDPLKRLEFPLRVLKRVIAVAHGEEERGTRSTKKMAVLVKFNVSELTEMDLPLSDVRLFARAFFDAGADLLVPSGGQVMVNGLHMLRGNAPVKEMANAQSNWFKKWIVRILGPWLIPEEEYREGFFLKRVLSVCLGAGIPLEKVCLIGGVHDVVTLLRATGRRITTDEFKVVSQEGRGGRGYGFGAVQMGRTLLADPNYCLKTGIAQSSIVKNEKDTVAYAQQAINCCDNSNSCIVDSTMALKPLKCTKYPMNDW
jgi:2,4-dienoyl-CoA reductase-like NADH-dependent reductase (Old Yellow Enzyme family)/nucleoside-diphosphate-sugar epimerase